MALNQDIAHIWIILQIVHYHKITNASTFNNLNGNYLIIAGT